MIMPVFVPTGCARGSARTWVWIAQDDERHDAACSVQSAAPASIGPKELLDVKVPKPKGEPWHSDLWLHRSQLGHLEANTFDMPYLQCKQSIQTYSNHRGDLVVAATAAHTQHDST
jgi:hypothetical protein